MVQYFKGPIWAQALLFNIIPAAYGSGFVGHSSYCCNILEDALGDAIYSRSSNEYTVQNTFWAVQANLSPTCVLAPKSTDDLATAMKILVQDSCIFAVRGGGHSSIPGWASTNDGVLISLGNFRDAVVKDGYARVGAGNRWGEVYRRLEDHDLTVAGGRLSGVGVSGLTLGGGLTWLTSEHGFACDNVKNFEIVTAAGDILHANAESHPELFKGLKGAGPSNFGIITNFDLYTYPHNSKVYGGMYIYNEDKAPQILSEAFNYATTGASADVKSHLISTFAWTKDAGTVSPAVIAYYNGHVDNDNPPEALRRFSDIPMVLNTGSMQNTSQVADAVGYPEGGARQFLSSITVVAKEEELMAELHTIWRESLELLKPYLVSAVSGFVPIPDTAIAAGFTKGGNSMGFKPDDKNLMHVFWFNAWTDAKFDSRVASICNDMITKSSRAAKRRDSLHPFQYLNYASKDQDPIASYGKESVKDLTKLQKEYDPMGVFTKLVKGGFKIPEQTERFEL
ncbi:uncharacterized protein LAJ45_10769 [Morchella importuna]|uniref:uncharacterized protein n=1 Tax=Morchella importuna TaxID=1174673 RepID=UPI001E8E293D|nr:uncharacterized protein LAJ45_10769 [Morchella importuna]KAH8145208.1 hypothetical protein LAJ45_10769 [Morchella importuna]